jgi:thioredoxin 1
MGQASDPTGRSGPLIALAAIAISVISAGAWSMQSWRAASDATPVAIPEDIVQRALRLGKPTIAEFGSSKCVSCREMKVTLDYLALEHGERVSVVTVDLLANRDYIGRYKIQMMPTQVFFDAGGREIGRHIGRIGVEEILGRLSMGSLP